MASSPYILAFTASSSLPQNLLLLEWLVQCHTHLTVLHQKPHTTIPLDTTLVQILTNTQNLEISKPIATVLAKCIAQYYTYYPKSNGMGKTVNTLMDHVEGKDKSIGMQVRIAAAHILAEMTPLYKELATICPEVIFVLTKTTNKTDGILKAEIFKALCIVMQSAVKVQDQHIKDFAKLQAHFEKENNKQLQQQEKDMIMKNAKTSAIEKQLNSQSKESKDSRSSKIDEDIGACFIELRRTSLISIKQFLDQSPFNFSTVEKTNLMGRIPEAYADIEHSNETLRSVVRSYPASLPYFMRNFKEILHSGISQILSKGPPLLYADAFAMLLSLCHIYPLYISYAELLEYFRYTRSVVKTALKHPNLEESAWLLMSAITSGRTGFLSVVTPKVIPMWTVAVERGSLCCVKSLHEYLRYGTDYAAVVPILASLLSLPNMDDRSMITLYQAFQLIDPVHYEQLHANIIRRSVETFADLSSLKNMVIAVNLDFDQKTSDKSLDTIRHEAVVVKQEAIKLFAKLCPIQQATYQDVILEQMKMAVQGATGLRVGLILNCNVAVLLSVRNGAIKSTKAATAAIFMLQTDLGSEDYRIRKVCAEAYGRITRNLPEAAVHESLNWLIDQVAQNRNASQRCGQALALGYVVRYVGTLICGPHLKKIIHLLQALIAETNLEVQAWSLYSLFLVIESAGPSFESYISETLLLCIKQYLADKSDPYGDLDVNETIGQIINALVDTLGPEISVLDQTRGLIIMMQELFLLDTEEPTIIQGIRLFNQFVLLAPRYINVVVTLPRLITLITTNNKSHELKRVALNCVWQIILRCEDVDIEIISLAGALFELLDEDVYQSMYKEISDLVSALIAKSPDTILVQWIELIQALMNEPSTKANENVADPSSIMQQEDEGFAGGAGTAATEVKAKTRCLHTQLLALSTLQSVLHAAITKSLNLLQSKISSLIKIAYNASAAPNETLAMAGLDVIISILKTFVQHQDPDLPGHSFLEQYQAQISGAIAPGFSPESSPLVKAKACMTIAEYISSGISKNADSFTRLARMLYSCTMDEAKGIFSEHGDKVVFLGSLHAWAFLFIQEKQKPYLQAINECIVDHVGGIWVKFLSEHAQLQLEMDMTAEVKASFLEGLDTVHVAIVQDILQPLYERAWKQVLHALCSTLQSRPTKIIPAFDDPEMTGVPPYDYGTPRVFYALFGLCFESGCATLSRLASKRPQDDRPESIKSLADCLAVLGSLAAQVFTGSRGLDTNVLTQLIILLSSANTQAGPDQDVILGSLSILKTVIACSDNNSTELSAFVFDYVTQLVQRHHHSDSTIINRCVDMLGTLFQHWTDDPSNVELLLIFYRGLLANKHHSEQSDEMEPEVMNLRFLQVCLCSMSNQHADVLDFIGPLTAILIEEILQQDQAKHTMVFAFLEALTKAEVDSTLAPTFVWQYLYPNFIMWTQQMSTMEQSDITDDCIHSLMKCSLIMLPKNSDRGLQTVSILLPVFAQLLCQANKNNMRLIGALMLPMITSYPAAFKNFLNNECDQYSKVIIEQQMREAISPSNREYSDNSRSVTPSNQAPKVILKMKF